MSDSLPPNSRVFVGTSAYVALVRAADGQHERARHIMDRIVGAQARLFITNFVIAEIHAFLVTRSGIPLATRFIQDVGVSAINAIRVGVEDGECLLPKKSHPDTRFAQKVGRRHWAMVAYSQVYLRVVFRPMPCIFTRARPFER
jgi:predicted nucleic acid-binding protein